MSAQAAITTANPEQSTAGTVVTFIAALVIGAVLETLVASLGHRKEGWDSPLYWRVAWPGMVATAFICGIISRRRLWLIGYAPFGGGFAAMLIRTGLGSMWPLGLVATGVLALPGIAAAYVGKVVRKKFAY